MEENREESQKSGPTIKTSVKILMVGTALCIDILGILFALIPVLGQIINWFMNITAQFGFWLWFKTNGVSYGTAKRASAVVAGSVIGLIPFVDMIPELTLQIIMILSTLQIQKVTENIPGGKIASSAITKK